MTQHDLDCEQALSRLFDFLDHELDGEERDTLQRHLATCRSCWSRAEFERRLKARLRETRAPEPAVRAVGRIRRLLQTF